MVFEHIEKLQRQLTDKYVVVDESRPELKRFSGMTGVVKTVNFGGRALVEFDANNNIGWFDIDPQFLKVIDAPLAKPGAKEAKAEKKAAPAKVEKPAAKAEAKPAAAKPATAGSVADILAAARSGAKPAAAATGSVADVLAAARAGTQPAAKAEATPSAKPMSTADILAAARTKPDQAAAPAPAAPAAPTKVDPKKLSVADMLAMARGQKAAGEAPAQPAPKAAPVTAAPAAETVPEAEVTEPEAAVEPVSSAAGGPVKVDRTTMDVAAMVAYCRKADGGAG